MVKRYAVMGSPIAHSESPRIHKNLAAERSVTIEYDAIEVRAGNLKRALYEFQSSGGSGVNITAPLKQEALTCVDQITESAKDANAVNTILFSDAGTSIAYNTDGIGFIQDLKKNKNFSFKEKSVLIIGAGGAVAGILPEIIKQNPKSIILGNRTLQKLKQLSLQFSYDIPTYDLVSIPIKTYDIIINATSASMMNEHIGLSTNLITPQTACYDLVYKPTPTVFLNWADELGAQWVSDGYGMLQEQAKAAFEIWHPEQKNI